MVTNGFIYKHIYMVTNIYHICVYMFDIVKILSNAIVLKFKELQLDQDRHLSLLSE